MMESMSEQQTLYNEALNSTGALEEANSVKAESVEGKLNTLKDTVKEMWSNFIDSDAIKDLIDDITKLVETLGKIPAPVVTTVAKMTALAIGLGIGSKAVLSLVSGLKVLKVALIGTSLAGLGTQAVEGATKIGILTKAINALSLSVNSMGMVGTVKTGASALLSSPLGWLVLAVSAIALVDKGLTALDNKIRGNKDKTMDDVQDKVEAVNNSITSSENTDKLITQYKKITNELKKANLSEEEKFSKNEQLQTIKEQLASTESKYKDILDDENLTIDEQIDKMKEINNVEVRDKLKDLDESMMGQKDIEREKQELERKLELYQKIQEAKKAKKMDKEDMISYDGSNYSAEAFLRYYADDKETGDNGKLNSLTNEINDANSEINDYNSTLKKFEENNYKTSRSVITLSDSEKELINQMNGAESSTDKLIKRKLELRSSLADIWGANVDYNQEEQESKAESDFTNSIEQIEKIQKIINEVGNNKKFDDDTIKQMISEFPELAGHINDTSYCVDYMNQKIQNLETNQKSAYQNMLANSTEYFQSNVANTEEWKQFTEQAYSTLANSDNDYIRSLADGMKINFENCKSLNQAKLELEKQTIKILAEAWSEYYTSIKAINEAQKEKTGVSGDYVAYGSDAYNRGLESGTFYGGKDAEKRNAEADKISEVYETKVKELADLQKNLDGKFSITVPDFVGTIGSNITDNKDSSKSKFEEKDYSVEDVEDLTDAYHDLNNAITLVEAKLKQLQARYENLYGKSKAQAMQEQVDILRQQLDLHSQMESKINSELAKQRSELASQGVTFDSSGMISNYNEILTSLRNQANAIQTVDENSKKAKEDSIKSLKDLKSKMDDYNSSITKDLEEQKTTWLELQNQIKETYKTMEKMVTDGESKVTDVIKSEIDKRKEKEKEAVEEELKQIDKVKEALQDQWDTDDYEDQLQEAQDKVMEYEEKIREAIKNGDMNSLTDLKKEQQDALKELNDTVKQHERDMINNEMDDQSDALNKKSEEIDKKYEEMEKSENLTKMVTEALQTGFFKINDEVISLSSAMSDFVKESTVGIGTINQTTRELNQTLADTLAMLNQLGGYNGLTNLLPNVPYQMLANNTGTIDRNTVFTDSGNNTRSILIKLGDMYVNGNLDNVTLEDVNNTISKRFKEVVGNYIS